MKRICSLLLASCLLIGTVTAAHAVDVKVKGTWDFVFGWSGNNTFANSHRASQTGIRNDDKFAARQLIKTQIDFIASENLQGVLLFEMGITDWGRNGTGNGNAGGALDADGINIKTKRAYLDWKIPDTSVSIRTGIQGIFMPMATSYVSPVLANDVAGILANYKFNDTIALTAFWARPFDQYANDGTYKDSAGKTQSNHFDDETDLFGLVLPITLDGVSLTPWGIWGRVGSASGFYEYAGYFEADDTKPSTTPPSNPRYTQNTSASIWWTGLATKVTALDPLTFAVDAMYGHLQKASVYADSSSKNQDISASGWFLTAALDYKQDWGTPRLFGWWSTGDTVKGLNSNHHGRMPVLGTDIGFSPTSFGFSGAKIFLLKQKVISDSAIGTAAIGAQISNLSFVDKLTHTIRVAYIRGTNEHEIVKGGTATKKLRNNNQYLTDKDYAIEVNFDHKYQIYDNLAAFVELGYINLNLDKNTWKDSSRKTYKTNDAWKAQVLMRYDF